jgi:hypothetical protein
MSISCGGFHRPILSNRLLIRVSAEDRPLAPRSIRQPGISGQFDHDGLVRRIINAAIGFINGDQPSGFLRALAREVAVAQPQAPRR